MTEHELSHAREAASSTPGAAGGRGRGRAGSRSIDFWWKFATRVHTAKRKTRRKSFSARRLVRVSPKIRGTTRSICTWASSLCGVRQLFKLDLCLTAARADRDGPGSAPGPGLADDGMPLAFT